jgi:methanogenic corrinoid protein MtbC1
MDSKPKNTKKGTPGLGQATAGAPYWLSRAIEAEVARAIPSIVRAHAHEASSADSSAAQSHDSVGRDGSVSNPSDPPGSSSGRVVRPTESDVAAAARFGVAGDHLGLRDLITGLRARAVPLTGIYLDLIGAAARQLGDRWTEDEVNFVEVTFATGVFEAALRELMPSLEAEVASVKSGDAEVGRILLAGLPDDLHRMGMTMIGGFFRGAGWQVRDGLDSSLQELERIVAVEWFEVIGLSASCDRFLDLLSFTLTRLRRASCNPSVGFLVGGAQFVERPGLMTLVGADATAGDAHEALREAERLRARSRAMPANANS